MKIRDLLPERVNPEVIEPGYQLRRQLSNGYVIEIRAREPYYNDPDPDMRELRGVEVRVFDPNNQSWMKQKYGIAEARFLARQNRDTGEWNLRATMVNVDDAYQRQGIASAMYNLVRRLGNDVVPGVAQTDLGKAFWNTGAGAGRELSVQDLPEPPPPPPPPPKTVPEPPTLAPQSFRDRWRRILFPNKELA